MYSLVPQVGWEEGGGEGAGGQKNTEPVLNQNISQSRNQNTTSAPRGTCSGTFHDQSTATTYQIAAAAAAFRESFGLSLP
jgi:hypothetical protein